MATEFQVGPSALLEYDLSLKVSEYQSEPSALLEYYLTLKTTLQERLERAQHALTTARIKLHLHHSHASRICEHHAKTVRFYEAKIQTGDQDYVQDKAGAEKDLEKTISFHTYVIDTYYKRTIGDALKEVKAIGQFRERIEKCLEELELRGIGRG